MPGNSRGVPQEHLWFYTESGWGDKAGTGPQVSTPRGYMRGKGYVKKKMYYI